MEQVSDHRVSSHRTNTVNIVSVSSTHLDVYKRQAENVAHTSSAFSFAQNDIDHVLRLGGNTDQMCIRDRPYSAERRKAASERAKAAGYQPPMRKSGS